MNQFWKESKSHKTILYHIYPMHVDVYNQSTNQVKIAILM